MRKPIHPSAGRTAHLPALPPAARWAARLVVIVPLTAFVWETGTTFVKVAHLLWHDRTPIVAAEASRQLKRGVRLKDVTWVRLGVLRLDGLAVSTKTSFAESHGESFAAADHVTIHYDWHALLFDSGNATHALGDVMIDHPTLVVERYSNQQFNFSDLLNGPKKPNQKPFVGRILFKDGLLLFRDFVASVPGHGRPAVNKVTGINGTVDLHSERLAYFDILAHGDVNRAPIVKLRGDASRKVAARFRIDLQAPNADVPYWKAYFNAAPQVRIPQGKVDVDVTVQEWRKILVKGALPDLVGHATVHNATAIFNDRHLLTQPVRQINAVADFTGTGANVRGTLAVNGQQASVQGLVFDFKQPQMALTLRAVHLIPARLATAAPWLPLPVGLDIAPGTVLAQITGSPNQPSITADLTFPRFSYQGNSATDVRSQIVFANKILYVQSATARLTNGAPLVFTGTFGPAPTNNTDLNALPIIAGGRVTGLNLALVHLPPALAAKVKSLGGKADIAFVADNRAHPLAVTANVTVAHGKALGTDFESIRGRVAWAPGHPLTIDRLIVQDPKGLATLSGTIPTAPQSGPWDVNVAAAGLDLKALSAPFIASNAPHVDGLGYFRGRIVGPFATPQAQGDVQILGGQYGTNWIDTLGGFVVADATSIKLQNFQVRRYPADASVSGTITQFASGNPLLNLNVSFAQAEIQDFVDLATQYQPPQKKVKTPPSKAARQVAAALPLVTGTAQGVFQITGRAKNPLVSGQATVTDATVGAYRIDRVRADVTYRKGIVALDHALVNGEGATVTAQGQFATDTGAIQGVFHGTGLDFERFSSLTRRYADVSGIVDLSGTIGGTVKSPTASLSAAAHGLVVNGQKLADFHGAARYDDGIVTQIGDPWEIMFTHPEAITNPDARIRYIVDSFRIALPTPEHPTRPKTMALAAHIPDDSPERIKHLTETLRGSVFAQTPSGKKILAQLDSLPQPFIAKISIPVFTLDGPLDQLTAHAVTNVNGLKVGDNTLASATLNIDSIGGPERSTHLVATAKDLTLDGVNLQTVNADAAMTGQVITVNTLRMRSERAYLEASGHADLEGSMAATLDASDVPLSLFNLFLPHGRELTGEISALSINAYGLTKSPDMTASLNLSNPGIVLTDPTPGSKPQTYSLDRIRSGAISLASTRGTPTKILTITDLAAFKNGRPIATLSGNLPFRWKNLAMSTPDLPTDQDLHAELRIDDLGLLAPFVTVIDPKRTKGALTASIDVKEQEGVRKMAGSATLVDASLGLTDFSTSIDKLAANVTFDNEKIEIGQFNAHSSAGGAVNLTGNAHLGNKDALNLHLHFDGLKVDETKSQSLLVKNYGSGFRGKLTGDLGITGAQDQPLIATAANAPLVLTDTDVRIPSASPPTGSGQQTMTFDPRFNVNIALAGQGKTIHVSNALVRLDAYGDFALKGTLAEPSFNANLNVAKGQMILPPSTVLKLVRPFGYVKLAYPGPKDPETGLATLTKQVDLYAQANVSVRPSLLAATSSVTTGDLSIAQAHSTSATDPSLDRPRRYTISAHISGVLDDPNKLKLDLTSSPGGLSQAQMLASLGQVGALSSLIAGGGGMESALKDQVASAFSSILLPTVFQPLETGIQSAFGLSDFSFDYSTEGAATISLVKDLSPRISLSYTKFVGGRNPVAITGNIAPQTTIKLGYSLTDRLQVSVSTDNQQDNTVAIEGVFGF